MSPPPPVMVTPGEAWVGGATFAWTAAPSTVVATSPQTGQVVVHDARDGVESPVSPVLDPRLSLVHAPGEHFAWSAHMGWLSAGLDVRYLPFGTGGRAPLILGLGGLTYGPLVWYALAQDRSKDDGGSSSGVVRSPWPWEVRVTASLHPALSMRWRGMVGLGGSAGRRRRSVILPADAPGALGQNEADNLLPPAFNLVRQETRAEALVGVAWLASDRLRLVLALQPFAVVAAGTPSARCQLCVADAQLLSFDSTWGVVTSMTAMLMMK